MKRQSRFEEGDTAGWKKWLKEQPKEFQEEWAANTEKYGDLFSKQAGSKLASGTVSMFKNEMEKYREKYESITYDIYKIHWNDSVGRPREGIVHIFSDGTVEIMEEDLKTFRLRTVINKTRKVFGDDVAILENYFFDKENVRHDLIRADVEY